MHHSFDVDLATKYGIAPAILLEYIGHWVVYNRSLNQNKEKGKFWTYNTVSAMHEQFLYLSVEQIRYAIRKLKDAKLIMVDKLSTDKLNTTNWYTLTDKGEKVCSICDIPPTEIPKCDCEISQTQLGNLPNDKDLLHYNIANNTLHTNPLLSPTQKTYADDVKMTEGEYQKLVDKYGEQGTQEMIEILSNYKGSSGKKYKSDYKAILTWVVKQWQENHREKHGKQYKTIEEQAAEAEERLRRKGIFL